MNITKFMISDTEYLIINPECIHENECETCTEIDIDYVNEKNNLCIRFGYKPFRSFCNFIINSEVIQELINGTRTLDKNIINDVGFEWNEYFAGKRGPTKADQYFWVSNDHKQIRPYYSSWLYNDEEANVIFKITPDYPWHYETKKTCPEKISYNEWIKNYKPIVKTIVSKENLKQWITQAKELAKVYKLNL